MNLDWLQSFLLTVQCKSLSKASDQRNLSQPALSKQIRKLEDELGVSLFQRTPQGMEITPEGEWFYERIQPLLRELHIIRTELQQFHSAQLIKIATVPSLVSNYLPHKMVTLQRKNLEFTVSILHTSEELLTSLQSGAIDIAIMERDGLPDSLWRAELFTEPYVAILPKHHPLSSRDTLKIDDLQKEAMIVHPEPCHIRRTIFQMYQEQGYTPTISSEVAFGQFIVSLVEAGAGITIVPQSMVPRPSNPNLAVVPLSDFPATRTIAIVSHSKTLGQRVFELFQEHQ